MMLFEHDPDADAIYIQLIDAPVAYTRALDDDRIIDYAADHQPRGVELLGVSHGVNLDAVPARHAIDRLLQDHNIKVFA